MSHNKNIATDAYNEKGDAKLESGDFEGAIKNYDKVLKLDSKDAHAYYNRGFAKATLGKHKEAMADYNRTIKLKSDYAPSYNNRGGCKKSLGKYKEAIADYDKAIEINLSNVMYLKARQRVQKKLDDSQSST